MISILYYFSYIFVCKGLFRAYDEVVNETVYKTVTAGSNPATLFLMDGECQSGYLEDICPRTKRIDKVGDLTWT